MEILHYSKKSFLLILSFVIFTNCMHSFPKRDEATVQISINKEMRYQQIQGFGTCLITFTTWPEDYHRGSFWDSVVNDLGLSMIRIPMPEHMERYNDDDDPDHFNWSGYYLGDNDNRSGFHSGMYLLNQLKTRGVKQILATPWSPPDFTKTNKSPIEGGFLRPDMYAEYAEYMSAYVIMAKEIYDIDINAVSLQNELLFIEPYRSCIYHPYAAREGVRALMRKFNSEGINTKIVMPEDMMFTRRMMSYILPVMNDPETKYFPGFFGTHRHGGGEELKEFYEKTRNYYKGYWMTETSGHNPDWNGAFKMAFDMYEYLETGHFNAWIYWQITDNNPTGRYSLMMNGKPTPKYYAAKHFYRHIRPGVFRIGSTSTDEQLLVTSYFDPVTGKISSVWINNSDSAKKVSLNAPGYNQKRFRVFQSDSLHFHTDLGVLNSDRHGLVLPPKSVTTIVAIKGKHKESDCSISWPESYFADKSRQYDFNADTSKKMNRELYINDEIVNELIAENRMDEQLVKGRTALHLAVLKGEGDLVEKLLKNGANVNVPDTFGWTPLHVASAAFGGHGSYSKYDVFRMIMRNDPDFSIVTKEGFTALHVAAMNMHRAYRQNEIEDVNRIKDLINAGIDVNARDMYGRTALHWAAWTGYPFLEGELKIGDWIVEKLIEMGADVNLTDIRGRTAMHYAAEMGYERIVQSLMRANANVRVLDNEIKTPLDLAMRRHDDNLAYIIQNKVVPDGYSAATAQVSVPKGYLGKELLDAAWKGDVEKVKLLLSNGADIYFIDSDGFRAIDRARDNGHNAIVEILKLAAH